MSAAWALVALAVLLAPTRRTRGAGLTPGATSRGPVLRAVASLGPAGALYVLLADPAGPADSHAPVVAPVVAAGCGVVVWLLLKRRGFGDGTRRTIASDPALPLVLELAAAALRAGRPPPDALAAAAPAAGAEAAAALQRVAALLRLGAPAEQAWSGPTSDPALAPVAVSAVRSSASGARLAIAFDRLAEELRAEAAAAAGARAHRAGVLAMAPLAACFLPSFVLLGVVPVVVGMARTVFATGV